MKQFYEANRNSVRIPEHFSKLINVSAENDKSSATWPLDVLKAFYPRTTSMYYLVQTPFSTRNFQKVLICYWNMTVRYETNHISMHPNYWWDIAHIFHRSPHTSNPLYLANNIFEFKLRKSPLSQYDHKPTITMITRCQKKNTSLYTIYTPWDNGAISVCWNFKI